MMQAVVAMVLAMLMAVARAGQQHPLPAARPYYPYVGFAPPKCPSNTVSPTSDYQTISVANGGAYGCWGDVQLCPSNSVAVGFSLKVEPPQGPKADDTALNGITLICNDSIGTRISSTQGQWGDETLTKFCSSGSLSQFELRVEKEQGDGDDTSANDINFKCTNEETLNGNSVAPWGDWTQSSRACPNGIRGIQTRVEAPMYARGDDTALNDVVFVC